MTLVKPFVDSIGVLFLLKHQIANREKRLIKLAQSKSLLKFAKKRLSILFAFKLGINIFIFIIMSGIYLAKLFPKRENGRSVTPRATL